MVIPLPLETGTAADVSYSYSPSKIPETFQELKLPPSVFPIGIATENLCFPGERVVTGKYTGLVAVPGHQPERLPSLDVIPFQKLPDAGLYFR